MKPIPFKTDMVNGILQLRKWKTRRVIKKTPFKPDFKMPMPLEEYISKLKELDKKGYKRMITEGKYAGYVTPAFKYGGVGDLLWVKETYAYIDCEGDDNGYVYKASENGLLWAANDKSWKWKPSMFMPRIAARLFLEITDVKVERLSDMTEEEAIAEGVESLDAFKALWISINKVWNPNEFVFVYSFKIVSHEHNK